MKKNVLLFIYLSILTGCMTGNRGSVRESYDNYDNENSFIINAEVQDVLSPTRALAFYEKKATRYYIVIEDTIPLYTGKKIKDRYYYTGTYDWTATDFYGRVKKVTSPVYSKHSKSNRK